MWLEKIVKQSGLIKGIHNEVYALGEPFIETVRRFSDCTGTVALLSGGDADSARYHILATDPWLTVTAQGTQIAVTTGDDVTFHADPFDTLQHLLDTYRLEEDKDAFGPVKAGLFGYLSYDLKNFIETIPHTSIDDLKLPHMVLFAPSVILVHDRLLGLTKLTIPIREGGIADSIELVRHKFLEIMQGNQAVSSGNPGKASGLKSIVSKNEYIAAVEKIKEYIRAGEIYQANLSQRFEARFEGSGFELFCELYEKNPAPFFSFINAGSHQVISTSPERFLQRTSKIIETHPIKGTSPRSKDPIEDQRLKSELLQSAKNDAELSMIVDLMRNDLGKVCDAGTIEVKEHKKIEAYQNVYHLVSKVAGKLSAGVSPTELIKAVFPGGSITGCPKIRAMEIIDELELCRRHIYTGAIGYIGFHDTMDLSIAIRTATLVNQRLLFSVGGGIVHDSNPEEEYEETLKKGETLLGILKERSKRVAPVEKVWINGQIKPLADSHISVDDPGLQYGYGFFETMRADKGIPHFLDKHIERFNQTWIDLYQNEPADISWSTVIRLLLKENGLLDRTAVVKLISTEGGVSNTFADFNLIITAKPYQNRFDSLDTGGIKLKTYRETRRTPLASYKTLNYLFYYLAGVWAKSNGADEALILNPDKTVSETNTANILLIKDHQVIKPVSDHVLPGITANIICEILRGWGYQITSAKLTLDDMFAAEQVLITNSLIGGVPVGYLDDKPLKNRSALCQKLNTGIFK